MSRRLAVLALVAIVVLYVVDIALLPRDAKAPVRVTTIAEKTAVRYRGHTAAYWAAVVRHRNRQIQATQAHLHEKWAPTVTYALRLASAATGVPYRDLSSVATCESHRYPFARNGKYKGLFQLGWSPFGMSPYDPVANALSAALTVVRDGSWRQWECKP